MSGLITALNNAGVGFCHHALWMLVQVSILVGILWGLDLALRKRVRASVRYCVWLLVLVKLVLPVDLRLPVSPGYWLNTGSEAAVSNIQTNRVETVFDGNPIESINRPAQIDPASAEPNPITGAETQALIVPTGIAVPSLTVQGWLFLAWIIGATAMLTLLVIQMIQVHGVWRRSRPISEDVAGILRELQNRMAVAPAVDIRQSDEVGSPAVCGLLRPVILIPSGLAEKLSGEQLETVLLHELMHIQRYDLWVNFFQTILQIFYFYNPFVRLANCRIRKMREQANDEQVLVHLQGRREHYSAALIEVAAAGLGRPMWAVRLIGVAEPKSHLHERITLMMQRPIPRTARLGLWGTLTLVLLAIALLPMAGRMQAAAAQSKETAPAITPEQFLAGVKPIYQNMLKGSAMADAGVMTSCYAEDAVVLAKGANPAIGKTAIVEMVNESIQKGERFVAADVQYQEVRRSGRYILSLDRGAFTVRTPMVPHLIQAYCTTVTVFEIQPDGTLKSKAEAWNYEQPPAADQLLSGTGITAKPDAFRMDPASQKTADASPETLDTVKQLDKQFHADCLKADAALVASYFAPDAVYIGEETGIMRGQNAIKARTTALLRQLQLEDLGHRIIFAEGTEDMVYVVNTFEWKFKDVSTGNQLETYPGKGLHVWQKQADGAWKILMDVNSVNVQLP